jgi:hypothetical protein
VAFKWRNLYNYWAEPSKAAQHCTILSETWLDKAKIVYLKRFNHLKYSRKDGLYNGDGKIEVCEIEIYSGEDKILIVSCHRQPHTKIEPRYEKKFLAQFEGKLIGGDFNGHHDSCGNSKYCTAGNNLFDCVVEFETNITLLNDGSQTYTYISDAAGIKAALDLTFVGKRSALLYIWKARTDPWNNDHFPICIEYDGIIEQRKGSKKPSRLHNRHRLDSPYRKS